MEIFVTQVACGDSFSLAVSAKGEVYTWGLGNHGQLGISLKRGVIYNMADHHGVKYSKAIQRVKNFEKEPID
jgi:alpha-tubulin suppressor-like RCC1 family protein